MYVQKVEITLQKEIAEKLLANELVASIGRAFDRSEKTSPHKKGEGY
jgi:hypothetical protein